MITGTGKQVPCEYLLCASLCQALGTQVEKSKLFPAFLILIIPERYVMPRPAEGSMRSYRRCPVSPRLWCCFPRGS